jgi:hypothetical protein
VLPLALGDGLADGGAVGVGTGGVRQSQSSRVGVPGRAGRAGGCAGRAGTGTVAGCCTFAGGTG